VLGHPERHYDVVHVGGTNGKGSTAAMVSGILRAAGWRVGLYTSPHLVSFRERMVVDDVAIPEQAVAVWAERLHAAAEERGASFFEITTAIALADFATRGVDVAVVEVGLGGRLDATNVVRPLAAGVTRIALEHTDYLGPDLASIAGEKAGIAKRGVPFVTTEPADEVAAVLERGARARGAVFERFDVSRAVTALVADGAGVTFDLWTPVRHYPGLRTSLGGAHQSSNAALAVRLSELLPGRYGVDEAAVRAGIASAKVPGRFERRGRWIFDVAHNPDGARALAAALAAARPPRPLAAVVGVLRDKAWREFLSTLAPAVDALVLTRAPSAPEDRVWSPGEAAAWCAEAGIAARAEPVFEAALAAARAAGRTVLVTGSFHTVGDAMARLPGMAPLG
jgi:dihydrofolate synthase/folylpolyglutamate synthase